MTHDCIVGIDGSDTAVAALTWAVRNRPPAGREPGAVVAVTAWHVPLMLKALMVKRAFDVDRLGLVAEAEHHLDDAIERVRAVVADGGDIERLVVEGQPADVLLDRSADAGMLVVGRRGAGDLRQLLLGSVSRHCATHANVPTVVVPTDYDAGRVGAVTVGFDGSDESLAAVRWALDHFSSETTVRAVTAIDLSPWLDEETSRERLGDEITREEERIAALLADVDPDGEVDHHVVLGSPRAVLTEAAATSDLLVLGSSSRNPLVTAWLGSVSTWMLQWSPCPVAVVPS